MIMRGGVQLLWKEGAMNNGTRLRLGSQDGNCSAGPGLGAKVYEL